jgi:tetratricopeptide (TPR) repeat protein
MRACLTVGLVLLSLAAARGANAQSDRDDELARTLFLAGQTYYEQGEYELAEQQFERAYQLSPRPQLLMNVATSAERAGHLEKAIDSLERYLQEMPDLTDRAVLERRLDAMKRRLARQRAEEQRAAEAEASAGEDAVEAQEGDADVIVPGAEGIEESQVRERPGIGVPALVAYSAGAAGLVMFGVFGGLTIGEHNSVEGGCGATNSCTGDDLSRLRTLGIVADVGLAIGVVGAIVGTVLWMLHRRRHRQDARSASASPSFSAGGNGANLRLAF